MPPYIVFFLVGSSGLAVINYLMSRESNSPVDRRRRQQRNLLTENVLRAKISETIDERVKVTKRLKVEEMLDQAGLKMQYADYVMVSLLSSLVFAFFFGYTMSNPLLAMIFLVLGYFVPGQVIGIIKNKRTQMLEKQLGSFMQMVTKRYENTKDFHKALALTVPEFEGEEPIYSEIKRTLAEMNLGTGSEVALMDFAKRTNNKFMIRYAAFYELVASIGQEETRRDLLGQAIKQYQEDYELKRALKKEISGPVNEAYIMLSFVPVIAIYQAATNDQYIYIMTKTSMGRIGSAVIVSALIMIAWFINTKLGAPLD